MTWQDESFLRWLVDTSGHTVLRNIKFIKNIPARPILVEPAIVKQIRRQSESAVRMVKGLMDDSAWRDTIDKVETRSQVTAVYSDLVTPDVGEAGLARTDVVVDPEGVVKVVEVNVTSRLGLAFEHDILAEYLEQEPWFTSELELGVASRGYVSEAIVQMLRARGWGLGPVEIITGVAGSSHSKTYNLPFAVNHLFSSRGCQVTSSPVDSSARNEASSSSGATSLLYRLFGPEDFDHLSQRLVDLYRFGAEGVVTFSDVAGERYLGKLVMAPLSPLAFRTAEVESPFPWTKVVGTKWPGAESDTVELSGWVEKNRSDLVLKPALGSGGVWVVFGRELTLPEWRRALKSAAMSAQPWVLQEVVQPRTALLSKRSGTNVVKERRALCFSGIVVEGVCVGIMCKDGAPDAFNINTLRGASASPVYCDE